MSQEKVDRYKERKANRKKIHKKEKRKTFLYEAVAVLLCVAIIGYIGYSVYGLASSSSSDVAYTTVNIDAITNYESTLE